MIVVEFFESRQRGAVDHLLRERVPVSNVRGEKG